MVCSYVELPRHKVLKINAPSSNKRESLPSKIRVQNNILSECIIPNDLKA